MAPGSSLVELATLKCIQYALHIQDVGDTPFALLAPVLVRMSAKQLRSVEEHSPRIKPDLDRIWKTLIEKDFPDRPALPSGVTLYRELYIKYCDDRDEFRARSATRLRKMNEKLKESKSKITTVEPGVLREPRRRVPTMANPGGFPRLARPNTIMAKAKRDLQTRGMMFRPAQAPVPGRPRVAPPRPPAPRMAERGTAAVGGVNRPNPVRPGLGGAGTVNYGRVSPSGPRGGSSGPSGSVLHKYPTVVAPPRSESPPRRRRPRVRPEPEPSLSDDDVIILDDLPPPPHPPPQHSPPPPPPRARGRSPVAQATPVPERKRPALASSVFMPKRRPPRSQPRPRSQQPLPPTLGAGSPPSEDESYRSRSPIRAIRSSIFS